MGAQIPAYRMHPAVKYVCGHQHGPGFQGPCGAAVYVDGVAVLGDESPGVFTGAMLLSTGMVTIVAAFEHDPACVLTHDGEHWRYAPSVPAQPEPEPPSPTHCTATMANGKPCEARPRSGGLCGRHGG